VQDQRCLDIELLLSIIKDGRGFHLGEPFILRIRFSELTSIHQLAIPRNPSLKTPPSASPILRRSSTSTSLPPAHQQTKPNLRGPHYLHCRRTIARIKVSWLWHRWLWACCGMVIPPLIQSPIISCEINL